MPYRSKYVYFWPLQWRHNGHDRVSNHQPHECLFNHLFRSRSKKTSKLYVTGLCAGNSPGIGESPTQMTSNTENVSIWWHHNGMEYVILSLYNDLSGMQRFQHLELVIAWSSQSGTIWVSKRKLVAASWVTLKGIFIWVINIPVIEYCVASNCEKCLCYISYIYHIQVQTKNLTICSWE